MQSFNFGTLFKIVVESLSSLSSATHKFSILNFYFSFENTDSVETILLLTLKTCKVKILIKLSDWKITQLLDLSLYTPRHIGTVPDFGMWQTVWHFVWNQETHRLNRHLNFEEAQV